VAIDVATRSVLGCCLSVEAPSVLLVALCLENAVFPKADRLSTIGVDVRFRAGHLPQTVTPMTNRA
jgi:putative transposase